MPFSELFGQHHDFWFCSSIRCLCDYSLKFREIESSAEKLFVVDKVIATGHVGERKNIKSVLVGLFEDSIVGGIFEGFFEPKNSFSLPSYIDFSEIDLQALSSTIVSRLADQKLSTRSKEYFLLPQLREFTDVSSCLRIYLVDNVSNSYVVRSFTISWLIYIGRLERIPLNYAAWFVEFCRSISVWITYILDTLYDLRWEFAKCRISPLVNGIDLLDNIFKLLFHVQVRKRGCLSTILNSFLMCFIVTCKANESCCLIF